MLSVSLAPDDRICLLRNHISIRNLCIDAHRNVKIVLAIPGQINQSRTVTIQALLCTSDLPLSNWNEQLRESHSDEHCPSSQKTLCSFIKCRTKELVQDVLGKSQNSLLTEFRSGFITFISQHPRWCFHNRHLEITKSALAMISCHIHKDKEDLLSVAVCLHPRHLLFKIRYYLLIFFPYSWISLKIPPTQRLLRSFYLKWQASITKVVLPFCHGVGGITPGRMTKLFYVECDPENEVCTAKEFGSWLGNLPFKEGPSGSIHPSRVHP